MKTTDTHSSPRTRVPAVRIHDASTLSKHFATLVHSSVLPFKLSIIHPSPDLVVRIAIDALKTDMHICLSPTCSMEGVRTHLAKLGTPRQGSTAKPLLVVVPNLSTPFLDFCRDLGVSVMDLNGKAFIKSKTMLVSTERLPGRNFRTAATPVEIFKGKSARIVRTLLTGINRPWRQSEILERTQVTGALVSRIVRYLHQIQIVRSLSPRTFRIVEHSRLLSLWEKSASVHPYCTAHPFTTLLSEPCALARDLSAILKRRKISHALTLDVAAQARLERLEGFEPRTAAFYVESLPPPSFFEKLSILPVDQGSGTLLFIVPHDPGLLLETQEIGGLPLVSDAQLSIDINCLGFGSHTNAFNTLLRKKEDFCTQAIQANSNADSSIQISP